MFSGMHYTLITQAFWVACCEIFYQMFFVLFILLLTRAASLGLGRSCTRMTTNSSLSLVHATQQLQQRDAQLSSLQGELSEATGNLETLTSQLHHTRQKADPLLVNPQLYQVLCGTIVYCMQHTQYTTMSGNTL